MSKDQEIRRYFNVDDRLFEDLAEVWRVIAPHMSAVLDDFYGMVKSNPDLAKFFTSDQHMKHASAKQLAHWSKLFTGRFDSDYISSAERVGQVHYKIGLPNLYFMSMYTQATREIIHLLSAGSGPLGRKRNARLIEPAVTAVMIDCEVVSDSFKRAETEDQRFAFEKMGEIINEIAQGRMSARIGMPYPERYEANRMAFNSMAERLDAVFQTVSDNATGVNNMTQEVSRMADDLSERAQGQAAAVEQSNAAVSELANSLHENNESFKRAIEASARNRSGAESGLDAAGRANEAMEEIKTGFDDITKITANIEVISFQTNLLALNASVEAARAGEAGKGFAVVASEVSSLAKRAQELTDSIRTMITSSSAVVDKGAVLFDETKDALSQIMEAAASVGAEIENAVEAARTQALTIDEVKKALDSIDHVTQTNAAIAAGVADSCEGLSSSAQTMASPFETFKDSAGPGDMRNVA